MPEITPKLLRDVREGSFRAWGALQEYKKYFWLGPFAARLWLLIRYGWNDWNDDERPHFLDWGSK